MIKFNKNTWLKSNIDIDNAFFPKTMENVEKKPQKYQTCNKRKEKKLFSIRTKLSCYKVFHGIFYSNRSKSNSNTNE